MVSVITLAKYFPSIQSGLGISEQLVVFTRDGLLADKLSSWPSTETQQKGKIISLCSKLVNIFVQQHN